MLRMILKHTLGVICFFGIPFALVAGNEPMLKNEFIELKVSPENGGVISSFKYRGTEMTAESGLLNDLMWDEPAATSGYSRQPYSCTVLGDGTLHLRRQGTGIYKYVEINKYLRLPPNTCALLVKYEFRVKREACAPVEIKPWFHNFVAMDGTLRFLAPASGGVQVQEHRQEGKSRDVWYYDLLAGWLACINDRKIGLVMTPEYKTVNCFYHWFSYAKGGTMEWRMTPITVKDGESYVTEFRIQPFEGLSVVNGAGNGIVGGMTPEGTRLKIGVVSERTQSLNLTIGTLSGDKQQDAVTPWRQTVLKANAGTAVNYEIELPSADGKRILLATVNAMTTLLWSPAAMAIMPREKRITATSGKFDWRFSPLVEQPQRPHYAWAKPYAKGKIRTLMLYPPEAAIDLAELNNRMDIDPEFFPLVEESVNGGYVGYGMPAAGSSVTPGTKARRIFEESRKALAAAVENTKAEVIVIGERYLTRYPQRGIPWQSLPEAARRAIVSYVKKGGGLVYVNPTGLDGELQQAFCESQNNPPPEYIVGNFPFALFGNLRRENIRTAALGQGRIVFLNYRAMGMTPFRAHFPYDYSYEEISYSPAAKSILWAGGNTAGPGVRQIRQNGNELTISTDGTPYRRLQVVFWTGVRHTEKTLLMDYVPGGTIRFPLPQELPEGQVFANLSFVDANGKVLNWQQTVLAVTRPVRILDLNYSRKEAKLTLSVDAAQTATVKLQVKDLYGRIIFTSSRRADLTSGQSTLKIPCAPVSSATAVNFLEAEINPGAYPYARRVTAVSMQPQTAENGFRLLLWGSPNDYTPAAGLDGLTQMHEMGFGDCITGTLYNLVQNRYYAPFAGLRHALSNISHLGVKVPTAVKMQTGGPETLQRNPCLNDPEFRQQTAATIAEAARLTLPYAPELYLLGDEMSLTTEGGDIPLDICFSRHCLKEFGRYLQQKYRTLERLNSIWGSDFRSWNEVKPLTLAQTSKTKRYASWMDHRDFMDSVYAGWFKFAGDTIRSVNPQARIGESGIESKISAYGGYDWPRRMKCEDVIFFYGYGDLPISFGDRRRQILGSWSGYLAGEAKQQYDMWRNLLHGQNALGYWYQPLLFLGDATLSSYGRFLSVQIGELRAGLGRLLTEADYLYSPIAIYYSPDSLRLSYLLKTESPSDTYKCYRDNLDEWNRQLRECGYTPRFVDEEGISVGRLQDYKILILPYALIVKEKTAAKILEFVKNGGLVIADVQLGIYDEFGRRRPAGILDDLFAVTRRENNRLTVAPVRYEYRNESIAAQIYEPGLETHGRIVAKAKGQGFQFGGMRIAAKNAGGNADVTMTDHGLYLGALRCDFNIVADYLKQTGINPPLRLSDDRNIEISHFRQGAIDYYALMYLPEKAPGVNIAAAAVTDLEKAGKIIDIRFPQTGIVYDLRRGGSRPTGDKFTDFIVPGVATLYAVLPAPVKWDVAATDHAVAGRAWSYEIKHNLPGNLIVHVSVVDPQGKECRSLNGNLSVPPSGGKNVIHFAYNDPAGIWQIRYRNLISGEVKTVAVRLEPALNNFRKVNDK